MYHNYIQIKDESINPNFFGLSQLKKRQIFPTQIAYLDNLFYI